MSSIIISYLYKNSKEVIKEENLIKTQKEENLIKTQKEEKLKR